MKHTIYSHQRGNSKVPSNLQQEIIAAINNIRSIPGPKKATSLRQEFLDYIRKLGWSDQVIVSHDSKITITSMRQKVGLCFQTGNMGRVYADLIKLQTLYHDNVIKAAVIILPSKKAATKLGSNIANADRLVRELEVFVKVYDVPTLIFALE